MPLVITIEIAVHNICDTINIKKKKLVYAFSFIKKKKTVCQSPPFIVIIIINWICNLQKTKQNFRNNNALTITMLIGKLYFPFISYKCL